MYHLENQSDDALKPEKEKKENEETLSGDKANTEDNLDFKNSIDLTELSPEVKVQTVRENGFRDCAEPSPSQSIRLTKRGGMVIYAQISLHRARITFAPRDLTLFISTRKGLRRPLE